MTLGMPKLAPSDDLFENLAQGCAEVHRRLGPGFSKNTYEEALGYELKLRRLGFQRRIARPVFYRGTRLSSTYTIDLCVEGRFIVDIRAEAALSTVHRAQLRFRLRMTGIEAGLLVNFGGAKISDGLVLIRRAEGVLAKPRDALGGEDLDAEPLERSVA